MKKFISGFCIGATDLVPGISGSTVAFLLGIYDEIIESICTPSKKSFFFLLPILFGLATALLTLSPIIHALLDNDTGRTCLFFFFSGVMVATLQISVKRYPPRKKSSLFTLFIGFVLALAIVLYPSPSLADSGPSVGPFFPFMIFAGMLAVGAMLLPGISGSYMLLAIGSYPLVIKSLSNVSEGYPVLLSLGIGIALGAILFTPLIRWGLNHHSQATHSLLIGFMTGSLPAIWPGFNFLIGISLFGYLFVYLLDKTATNPQHTNKCF